MKFVKLFEQFLNESKYLKSGKLKSKVYHVSKLKIEKLGNTPIWFALEKSHSDDGWYKNALEEGDAFQYEASISGNIADAESSEVAQVFDEIGEDVFDWIAEIVGNPNATEVMFLKGTKALIKAGYDGIVYSDYDPRDWDADLDALLIFNGAKSVKNFKQIK